MKLKRTAWRAFEWCFIAYVLTDIWFLCTENYSWPDVLLMLAVAPILTVAMKFEDPLRSLGMWGSTGWFSFPTMPGFILVAVSAYAVVFLITALVVGWKK